MLRHVQSLVTTISAAGKSIRPLTFAELTPFVHAGHRSWASETVNLNRLLNKRWNLKTMTLRTGLTRPPQPLCESETAGTRGGQKCGVITQSTAHSDPLSGLTGSHNTVVWWYPPSRGLLQTAQECQDRDPTRSTAGRRIPTILCFVLCLSGSCISVVPVCLRCHPSSVFSYCSCFRARGSRRLRHLSVTGN